MIGKPLWLWWSEIDATTADVPKIRDPRRRDRWTSLIIVAYTQLRLARTLTDDLRRPWERAAPRAADPKPDTAESITKKRTGQTSS
jgi:hypothetical protein